MTEQEIDLLTKKLPNRLIGKRTGIIDDCLFLESYCTLHDVQCWMISGQLRIGKEYKVYIGNNLEYRINYKGMRTESDKIVYDYDIQTIQKLEYIELKLQIK